MQGVERSRRTREAIANALRAKSAWEGAEAALSARHQALAGIEQEVAEGPTLDAAKAMQLVEMLGKVREHLAVGEHEDQCPVCGQEIPLADLQRTIEDRLADLARFEDLSRRRRSAQDQVRSAEGVAESARKSLAGAAEKLWEIASCTPEGFAPIEMPEAVRASFAHNGSGLVEQPGRSAELIAACEPLIASLQAKEDVAFQARARITSIRALLTGAERSRETTLELETILKGLTTAYDVMRRARIEFTQRILDEVAQDCNALYAEIHPDEGIAINKIALDEQRRASIHQTMDFGEHTDIAPQAYLSEAHLDTFGFCFWLAFAKREHPNRDAVLVLDDVFSSVDAPHMTRISQLIVEERKHFAQVIITTHQREWREVFRNSHGPGGLVHLIELQSWNLLQGIFSYETPLAVDELRTILGAMPFKRQEAASTAGILLEATLDRLTFLYQCKVPRTRENKYTIASLMDYTTKLFSLIELTTPSSEPVRPGETFLKLRKLDPMRIRNQVGAHHNIDGMAVSDAEVRSFADLVARLVESVSCPICKQIPSKSTGTHFQCSCGAQLSPSKLS